MDHFLDGFGKDFVEDAEVIVIPGKQALTAFPYSPFRQDGKFHKEIIEEILRSYFSRLENPNEANRSWQVLDTGLRNEKNRIIVHNDQFLVPSEDINGFFWQQREGVELY